MSSIFRLFVSQNTGPLRRAIAASSAPGILQRPASAAFALTANQSLQLPASRFLSVASALRCSAESGEKSAAAAAEHNPLDRTRILTLEQALRYQASDAYQQTYGSGAVWEQYRRNHKGPFAPRRTRKTCVRKGHIATGNPCPICRDEYLLLDHRNLELLQQFISPHTGEILSYSLTGLCQRKHQQLVIAIERARDQGLLTFDVPFRQYDYADYYTAEQLRSANYQAPAATSS